MKTKKFYRDNLLINDEKLSVRLNLIMKVSTEMEFIPKINFEILDKYISAKTDTYGCGWCKKKGNPATLESYFVKTKSLTF